MAAERKYVLIPFAELKDEMINDCLETDFNTLRWNNDKTMTVLKYEGAKPASIAKYTDYTHAEILVEMAKPEWNPVKPILGK